MALQTGEKTGGFVVLRTDDLNEYRSRGIYLKHEATGCLIYHIHNDDEENLFAFTFRTPPKDSTGISHILEHTVLCGSRRYPIKDPFLAMLRGSMYTFLNAMTYPDKTIYPAGSVVEKDFFNLLSVYGDAVFFPLLKKEAFRQEGHRLEWNGDKRLDRVGIVYNEMKGVYSSEESIVADVSVRPLFPDNPYGFDSGGDPDHIPELTYEEFVEFHKTYYHPSNCRIVLYGNIPTEKTAAFIEDNFLSEFTAAGIESAIAFQPRWNVPQYVEKFWPSSEEDGTAGKTTLLLNWLTSPVTDSLKVLSFNVLTELLMGNSGSPLLKAVVESGLGEDLSPASGLETDLKELVFSVGLRGSDPGKRDAFVDLVFKTLNDLADKGIDPQLTESALRQVEFRIREIRPSGPFGLQLMKRMLKGWLHDADPVTTLLFSDDMKQLREKAAAGGYFEQLIREYLIDNPHRTVVTVRPDPKIGRTKREELRSELDLLESRMDEGGKLRIKEDNEALNIFQETPDTREDLDRIPFLKREDIPEKVILLPFGKEIRRGVPFYIHDYFTNGICYLDLVFDVSGLPDEENRMLPLFCRALSGTGLPGIPYDQVSREIALKTGGIGAGLESATTLRTGESLRFIYIRVKMLAGQINEAADLLEKIMLGMDTSDGIRLKDLTFELRNDMKGHIVPNGTNFVSLRSGSRFSPAMYQEELWHGISQLFYLNRWCGDGKKFPADKVKMLLDGIRSEVFVRDRLKISITTETEYLPALTERAEQLAAALPVSMPGKRNFTSETKNLPKGESLIVPSHVSYIAASIPGAGYGSPNHAHQILLSHLLRTGYLWEQIRMKGGAYGASAVNSGLEKLFTMTSYRDPNVARTLRAFPDGFRYIKNNLTDHDLLLALIGSVGKELRPMAPSDKSMVSLKRELFGMTDEIRQKKRDEMLMASVGDIKREAEELLSLWEERIISVLSGKDAVEEAAAEFPELTEQTLEIPL